MKEGHDQLCSLESRKKEKANHTSNNIVAKQKNKKRKLHGHYVSYEIKYKTKYKKIKLGKM